MSPTAGAAAELRKLAHVLDVPTDRLGAVAELPVEDLRALRIQAGDALFEADRLHFARVAALSRAVPGAVAAKLTEAVLPPLLAARTAELLEPHRATDLVGRISAGYLAEVALRMDAARTPHIVAAIPPQRVAEVAAELARRQEWVVIGGFVAHVSPQALAACVAGFDGEQLLRTAPVLDDPGRLDEIAGLLTDDQLDRLLTAAADHGLWAELEELVSRLAPTRLARLTARYALAPPAVRAAVEAAAGRGELSAPTRAALAG
jgi:hypothetical protein